MMVCRECLRVKASQAHEEAAILQEDWCISSTPERYAKCHDVGAQGSPNILIDCLCTLAMLDMHVPMNGLNSWGASVVTWRKWLGARLKARTAAGLWEPAAGWLPEWLSECAAEMVGGCAGRSELPGVDSFP